MLGKLNIVAQCLLKRHRCLSLTTTWLPATNKQILNSIGVILKKLNVVLLGACDSLLEKLYIVAKCLLKRQRELPRCLTYILRTGGCPTYTSYQLPTCKQLHSTIAAG